jgi:polar amino acid transport system permease protein
MRRLTEASGQTKSDFGRMRYHLDFAAPLGYWPELLTGGATTLGLSMASTVLGFGLGVLCALARTGRSATAARAAGAYVEAIRNTPLLVQIFIVYFGLASIGIKLGAFTAAIAALVINVGAYTAEIVRAGIEAVPRNQLEAAESLALGRWQVLRHVVLPPAIERVWPALTSQYVLLMLASSITSQISTEELTAVANRIQSDTFRSVETYLIVAVAYLVLSLVMRALFWAAGSYAFPRRRRLGTPL